MMGVEMVGDKKIDNKKIDNKKIDNKTIDEEVNYILYVIDSCKYCNDLIEEMNNYSSDTGIKYDIIKVKTLIERVPEKDNLVKKSFVLYNEDKTEKFEFPGVPALWIRDRNELVIGVEAITYLKEISQKISKEVLHG